MTLAYSILVTDIFFDYHPGVRSESDVVDWLLWVCGVLGLVCYIERVGEIACDGSSVGSGGGGGGFSLARPHP